MDCIDGLKKISDNSIDLIVTDPPYGLEFMGKDWDRAVPSTNIWKECLRVLKPGAFAFVMCIPRQDCLSKMIVNLGNAGLRTDFTSIYWTYSSGFPKAMNMGKAIESKVISGSANKQNFQNLKGKKKKRGLGYGKMHFREGDRPDDYQDGSFVEKVDFSSELGNKFNGSYAGFQPKPAVEIIIVAMKPLSEKSYVDQALKNRKGITWLDDCRIKTEEKILCQRGVTKNKNVYGDYNESYDYTGRKYQINGRFPANLLVSDDILNDGKNWDKGGSVPNTGKQHNLVYGEYEERPTWEAYNDSGSFSRYFDLDKWFSEQFKKLPEEVQKTFPFLITPKPSKNEKDKGLEYLDESDVKFFKTHGGSGKPSSTSKTYADGTPRPPTKMKNIHPTVKSIELMSYLITLGSREKDIVLDPFVGSGTTCVSAKMLYRKFIGMEINSEYVDIAKNRLKMICNIDEWI